MTVKNEDEYGKPSLSWRGDLRLAWTRLSRSLVMRDEKDFKCCCLVFYNALYYFQCR